MSDRYRKSEDFLKRALNTIPLGSQTFSKSKTQFPHGVSPYFIQRGKGSHVWDLDDNEYVDFCNGLAAVTLGYGDPDVTAAVSKQLEDGVIFSLPHPLEARVAEKIVEMVPCAEMVRFGKNGSDATAGAVRVARAYTNRDRIAVCGYHGWQDWYIGSTPRNRGVPKAVRELTHPFVYNEIESLHRLFAEHPDDFAAVILEPTNVSDPKPGFLEEVRDLAHRNGALLIFDETITGFRLRCGGAQELYGVTPDLATFGKGLANGYPLSAIAGKAEVMKLFEEVFFSFTFGGETLSLAAAEATLRKLSSEPVIEQLYRQGKKAVDGTRALIREYGMEDIVALAGHDCWNFLLFKDVGSYSQWQIKTLFFQEVFARGILMIGSHSMSYAHSDSDVEKLLSTYREVMPIVSAAVRYKKLESCLRCIPLEPLFKIR